MRVVLVTLKKELMSHCFSPVSYVIAVLFYLFRGFDVASSSLLFFYVPTDPDAFSMNYYGLPTTFVMTVLVPPLLTMRCFAEERRSGSLETLMTAPVRDFEIVLGKWLGAVLFYCLLWFPSVVLLWVLTRGPFLGTELAFGPVFSAYLGLFLLASLLMAVGCFTSSLTDNVLLAVLAAILFNFALIQAPRMIYPYVRPYLENHAIAELYQKLEVMDHFSNWFARGLVDTSLIAFYLAGAFCFLVLTCLSLQSRKLQ
ncbi:MAG: ABC transporter permease [Planctomycetota bacterium]